MENGLYFLGRSGWTWVSEVPISFNAVGNDLTEPDSLNISYTRQFEIANTGLLRKLLNGADQIDAESMEPYTLIPAKVIHNDEVIISGRAEMLNISGTWKVAIYEPERSLMDVLKNKRLRDLDLSRYNHKWDIQTIATFAGATEGIVYPVVDYGTLSDGVMPYDTFFPAIYQKDLVYQMLKESGVKAAGKWLTDPLYQQTIVPFVEESPTNQDQEWIDARTARVTVLGNTPLVLVNKQKVDMIIPFVVDDRPLDGFQDGKSNNFKPATNSYIADAPMRIKAFSSLAFSSSVSSGTAYVDLTLEKNGQRVAGDRFEATGLYNLRGQRMDSVIVDEFVEVEKGDSLRWRLRAGRQTKLGSMTTSFLFNEESTIASFTPDIEIKQGDTWKVSRNLPDMSCLDLLKSVALSRNSLIHYDDDTKTLEVVGLSGIVKDRAYAVDYSYRVEESNLPELSFKISPYAQKNRLTWIETELTKKPNGSTESNFGDGVILCEKETLDAEATLFEMPFAASTDSVRSVGSYGNPVLIETRTVTTSSGNVTVNKQSATPRLLLVEPTKTFDIPTKVLDEVTGKVVPATVKLTGCWFSRRPDLIRTENNRFSLCFDRVRGQISEESLIFRYFDGLKLVLRRPRMLTISMYLTSSIIADIDFRKLVQLKQVRAGGLYFENEYFYLNRINDYTPGETCSVTLISV